MEDYKFKLFIVEDSQTSKNMVDKVKNIIESALKASYHFEVVDILTNPQEAVKNRIIASPTLLVELPLSSRRFVGDIKDEQSLLAGLDIR